MDSVGDSQPERYGDTASGLYGYCPDTVTGSQVKLFTALCILESQQYRHFKVISVGVGYLLVKIGDITLTEESDCGRLNHKRS